MKNPSRLPMATSTGLCPCTSFMGLKSISPFSARTLPILLSSLACMPFARLTPTASRMVIRNSPKESIKTSLFMPERNPTVVQSVETSAAWLDGMLPVRQNISSNSSRTLCTLPENSLMHVLINCAQNQLKIQARKTGFEKNRRNCSFAGDIPTFYVIIKFCLVEIIYFSYYYNTMDFKILVAGADDEGRRLDKILKSLLASSSQGGLHQALRKKLIKVNGAKSEADRRITQGDKISVAAFLLEGVPHASPSAAQPLPYKIIFQNEHICFIDKPRGIPVQPSENSSESISQTVARCLGGTGGSLSFKAAPLHRLDRYTTGLLAVSKSAKGAREFSAMLQQHQIKKLYLALAEGDLAAAERWQDSLAYTEEENSKDKSGFHTVEFTDTGAPEAKTAITEATPLSHGEYRGTRLTLVQYCIETGKKHQIRAQSARHGHPLYGDSVYGAKKNESGFFYLHALSMGFAKDNSLGLPPLITAPLPADFAAITGTFKRNVR